MSEPFRYEDLELVRDFRALIDPEAYTPLPDDWRLGLADIVTSTQAIDGGRYKAVNMAGAAVIAAIGNAIGTLDFPFVFGGDGASFAAPPERAEEIGRVLSATVEWVSGAFDLTLRGALVPIAAIRAAGHEVGVARFAASEDVAYAMFSGGGHSWAEDELKAGRLPPLPSPGGREPDLTGLSCRFEGIRASHGVILSLIVRPHVGAEPDRVMDVLRRVLALAETLDRGGHPVPAGGPAQRWPASGLDLEARAARGRRPLALSRISVTLHAAFSHLVFRRGRPFGRFDPARYRRQLVANSDFRKFDDGLMMTLDCTPETAGAIEAVLAEAQRAGLVRFGVARQDEAVLTCVVPSPFQADHIHFVDGATGGYARAARDLKCRIA